MPSGRPSEPQLETADRLPTFNHPRMRCVVVGGGERAVCEASLSAVAVRRAGLAFKFQAPGGCVGPRCRGCANRGRYLARRLPAAAVAASAARRLRRRNGPLSRRLARALGLDVSAPACGLSLRRKGGQAPGWRRRRPTLARVDERPNPRRTANSRDGAGQPVAEVAQSAERRFRKPQVVGSSPTLGSSDPTL